VKKQNIIIMGRTKKYQNREDAITIQKTQVKNAQMRYKETRTCFRKYASPEQKALIKLLNHTILGKEDAVVLLDTAKNFKNTKLIADMLKELAPSQSSGGDSVETNIEIGNINVTINQNIPDLEKEVKDDNPEPNRTDI
jgi:threonine synthase